LNTDPGELPECPGVESWPAEFAVFWQVLLGGPAYAGAAAAPVMRMPARQLVARSLRIMITFRSGRAHRAPYTLNTAAAAIAFEVSFGRFAGPLARLGADRSNALAGPVN
jgi:hypothetical protein